MPRKQSAQRIPDVDPKGPAGAALTDAVQLKLRKFLGADYVDRSLAQYVVVMLAHKTEQHQVAENLVEFLGEVDAKELASWLFESLDSLLRPPPGSEPQQAQQAQQLQVGGGAAAAAAEEAQDHDGLELEMEEEAEEEGSEGEGSSDADTAELALDERRGSGEGGAARRLASAIVQDEFRRRGDRRARSRSRSPRRRRSYSPPRGRRASPPRRRSPPPPRGMYWEGATGNRYLGHDPYPYRAGGGWRGREHSPPRRRESPPHYAGRGHGQWGPPQPPGPWGEPPGLPRRAYMDGPWVRQDGGEGGRDGGSGGVFARLQQQQHYQHDVRWQDPAAAGLHYGGSGRAPAGPPPGLAAGMPVPGEGRRRPMSAVVGSASEATLDLSMAHEAMQQQQQQQQQHAMLARAPGQAAAGGSGSPELPPWERPAYMDLELQRQQQEQQEQQEQQQRQPQPLQQVVRLGSLELPPGQQQHPQQQEAGLALTLRPAAVSGHRGAPNPTSAAAFARALTEAAASLGLQSRSVASVPLPPQHNGGQQTTFQITIAQSGEGARQLSAPLLHQPALQEVLKQRLRQMEIELVKLRAEQAERLKQGAQRRHELSTAAKLDLTVRSVCIKHVHPAASERVLIAHFGACGFIERITFLRDPASGRKTGVAYLQYSSAAEAQAALGLDGSALLQRTIQVVPSDSPAARVAVSRALRASYPPPGLVPVPVPLFAAPMPPPAMRYAPGRSYNRSGGRGGRGGHGGRGHGSFKYVRPADQPAPGSDAAAAAGAPAEPAAPGAPRPAAAAAAAGHGGHESGGEHMAE